MPWVRIKEIPNDKDFMGIISGLVFNCPSCRMIKTPDGTDEKGKKKYKIVYEPVSVRKSSFRKRSVSGSLLSTLLLQVKNPLLKNKTYSPLDSSASVEVEVKRIMAASTLGDPYYDLIVFRKRTDMSDIESIYYYIRNAFAHGAFEVIGVTPGERAYKLESAKDGKIAAQMRLKEGTLKQYIEFSLYDATKVKSLQKPRTKKA